MLRRLFYPILVMIFGLFLLFWHSYYYAVTGFYGMLVTASAILNVVMAAAVIQAALKR